MATTKNRPGKRETQSGKTEVGTKHRYAVGIDLGTTNVVVAYADLTDESVKTRLLPIPQVVSAGQVENRSSLPSFLYLAEHEAGSASYDLPWATSSGFVVGEYARHQAAEVPTRVVAAAKSWLAHSKVDRHQPLLPWDAPDDVAKVSPIEASRRYLSHVLSAWNNAFPDSPLADQRVVLTVPASFDASARELTREAAFAAGLPEDLVLLEEPQAAVYAWLAETGDPWRQHLGLGDTLLVCDVGGGTTDFSLIGVDEEQGNLVLKRLAVGDHILVGGDNMDLALAHQAQAAFAEKGVDVDPWQSVALWHSCRAAKETLLSGGCQTCPITVLGRGSRLIGGTISIDLEQEKAAALILEGFFPKCGLEDQPVRRRASGFRELGLPYEWDTAITRHLARFLNVQGEIGQAVRPTRVLFNGGVFKGSALRARLMEVLADWFREGEPPRLLEGEQELDYAVAKGAAYYGKVKDGRGVRIRGGTARSYYVGIETAGPAVPGATRPLRLLCVVPFGMEEGTEAAVPSEEIGLLVGETAQFRFLSSPVRKHDQPGDVVERWDEAEIRETDSLQATLPASEAVEEEFVPVRFEARITELGVLELWCVSTISDDRWKLEFSVRGNGE